jgi:hypothetical protein
MRRLKCKCSVITVRAHCVLGVLHRLNALERNETHGRCHRTRVCPFVSVRRRIAWEKPVRSTASCRAVEAQRVGRVDVIEKKAEGPKVTGERVTLTEVSFLSTAAAGAKKCCQKSVKAQRAGRVDAVEMGSKKPKLRGDVEKVSIVVRHPTHERVGV